MEKGQKCSGSLEWKNEAERERDLSGGRHGSRTFLVVVGAAT